MYPTHLINGASRQFCPLARTRGTWVKGGSCGELINDVTDDIHPLDPGTILGGGRYELLSPLGGDEAAYLYRARRVKDARDVVLQVLSHHPAPGPGDTALQALEVAGFVHAIDAGRDKDFDVALTVYERFDGRPLVSKLVGSPLAPHDGTRLIRDVARIVAMMHEHGQTHGCLHVDAVVVGRDRARLLDPQFHPERLHRSSTSDDIKSLSLLFHRVLHGESVDLAAARMRNDLPRELSELIERGLQGEVETMREFSNRLDRILDDTTEAAGEVVLPVTEGGTMVGFQTTSTSSENPVLARENQVETAALGLDVLDFNVEMWGDDHVDDEDEPTIITKRSQVDSSKGSVRGTLTPPARASRSPWLFVGVVVGAMLLGGSVMMGAAAYYKQPSDVAGRVSK